jgi:Ca2+-binding EF-hand superfamily protein
MLKSNEVFREFDSKAKGFLGKKDLSCALIYATGRKLDHSELKSLFETHRSRCPIPGSDKFTFGIKLDQFEKLLKDHGYNNGNLRFTTSNRVL